jgi:hypothetical protein
VSPANRFSFGVILSFVLSASALGQQPIPESITQEQARHASKIRRTLDRYRPGTKLDVLLLDGSHHTGTLSQLGPDSFALADPSNAKPDSIDYLEVKRLQPTRKEYLAQQLGKAAHDAPKVVVITLSAVAVIAFLVLAVK